MDPWLGSTFTLPGPAGFRVTLHEMLGEGAYSTVYRCSLESQAGKDPNVYACKRIELGPDTEGCYLEAAIMKCIDLPYIVRAIEVLQISNARLIVQDLAVGALHSLTSIEVGPRLVG